MTSGAFVSMAPPSGEDYGLHAIAQHNATTSTEEFPPYQEDAKGLGIYQEGYYQEEASYLHNPPTPHSNTETEGVRTRSGRSTRRTDSPFSTSKSRTSKSPAARSKKEKKSKVLEKAKTPKLTAPLSVLTKDLDVPIKDMDAWVNRSAEVRRQEVERRHGYVTRPMNSFMLYRSAYAERTKQWATQNNHQVVSSVAGESWPMEPEEVRNQFNEWAKIERANHAAAHPQYKFSPSKATKKRRGEFSDDEEDASDLDGDPDGEYRDGGRSVRQRRNREQNELAYLPSTVGFESHPYYSQQGYEIPQYSYASTSRTLPSNISYDTSGIAYSPQTGTYVHTSLSQHHPSYGYAYMSQQDMRIPTPSSQHGAVQSLGGYGLPGQIGSSDDLFGSSRTGTPAMHQQQHYNQFSQPLYHQQQYQQQQHHQYQPSYHAQTPVQAQHLYEHQQYLQAAAQPQPAIDPSLEAALAAEAAAAVAVGESHFDEAIGDMAAGAGLVAAMPEYFEESTSPNQTLAPSWEPTAADLGGN